LKQHISKTSNNISVNIILFEEGKENYTYNDMFLLKKEELFKLK